MVIGRIGPQGKYLVQQMDFKRRQLNISQVYPQIHPYLLDGFSMDSKIHPREVQKNILGFLMDKKQGTKISPLGKMGPNIQT